MGLVAFGEQTVPSGITALLIAMMPVWVAVFGRDLPRRAAAAAGGRRHRRRLRRRRLPRRAVGVRRSGRARADRSRWPSSSRRSRGRAGRCSPRIAPSCRGVRSSRPASRCSSAARCCSSSGSPPARSASFDVGVVSAESFLALLYLTVIGSLLAFTTYGWMLRVAPLPFVSTYAYVNPVIAVILGLRHRRRGHRAADRRGRRRSSSRRWP